MYGVIVVMHVGLGVVKRWGRCFKFIIWGDKRKPVFIGRFSLYNTDIFKLLSLSEYCKSLYRKPLFNVLAVSPVLYLLIYDKLRTSINVCIT